MYADIINRTQSKDNTLIQGPEIFRTEISDSINCGFLLMKLNNFFQRAYNRYQAAKKMEMDLTYHLPS